MTTSLFKFIDQLGSHQGCGLWGMLYLSKFPTLGLMVPVLSLHRDKSANAKTDINTHMQRDVTFVVEKAHLPTLQCKSIVSSCNCIQWWWGGRVERRGGGEKILAKFAIFIFHFKDYEVQKKKSKTFARKLHQNKLYNSLFTLT